MKPAAPILATAAIVLKEPKYPENIGSAARIARNMGIPALIVAGGEEPDRERMLKTATHHAAPLIDALVRYDTLAEALAPFSLVVGSSARQGRQRGGGATPRVVLAELPPLLASNRTALLFGPEDRGLTNDDLALCHHLVTIPTADFASLNLAQAVAIIAYELQCAVRAAAPAAPAGVWPPGPKLAEVHELTAMYGHIEQVLRRIGFLRDNEADYWLHHIRAFLGRLGPRAKEARLIRGFCRQFLHYDNQRGNGSSGR